MSDKEKVLGNIRSSLRRSQPLDETLQAGLKQRLALHQKHVQPGFTGELLERLVQKHIALQGTLDRIQHKSELSVVLQNYMQEYSLPDSLVIGESVLFEDLNLPEHIKINRRPALDKDKICVSRAVAAVAETGTLVLRSSADSPLTHNYMPDHHVVLLETGTIVRWQEDIWTLLRQEASFPPRGVCFISGPSKTADIEQTIEYGAHGPRCLHLVLLDLEQD
ncbi:MAG: L-lactate dehydrogenase complex protein LldG [Parasphingorhabdus sp.]|jgi:L-lactate dehydrogenase complex protein LldG